MSATTPHTLRTIALWTCAALALFGCSADTGSATPAAEAQAAPPAVARAPQPVREAFAAYEALRAALARDAVGEVSAGALRLEKAARAAAAAPQKPEHTPLWEALATQALALKAAPVSDPDAVRKAFGEVSRALVAVLVAEPTLTEGLYAFKCPMAQGYQKWIQVDPKIANPYMGTQMLTCGSKTEPK